MGKVTSESVCEEGPAQTDCVFRAGVYFSAQVGNFWDKDFFLSWLPFSQRLFTMYLQSGGYNKEITVSKAAHTVHFPNFPQLASPAN